MPPNNEIEAALRRLIEERKVAAENARLAMRHIELKFHHEEQRHSCAVNALHFYLKALVEMTP
jgi:hypothetical protein